MNNSSAAIGCCCLLLFISALAAASDKERDKPKIESKLIENDQHESLSEELPATEFLDWNEILGIQDDNYDDPFLNSIMDSLDAEDDTFSFDLVDDSLDFTFDDIGNHADLSFNPDFITIDPFASEVTGYDEMEIYQSLVEQRFRELTERLEKLEDDNKYSESQLSDARKKIKKLEEKNNTLVQNYTYNLNDSVMINDMNQDEISTTDDD
jgi:hypothetical protein